MLKSFPFQERNYNFHGLLRFRLRSSSPEALHHFDVEYGHYRQEGGDPADLEVIVDPIGIAPWSQSRSTHLSKLATEDEVIAGTGRHKVARWRFAIQGLADQQTRFYCAAGPLSMDFLHNRYVEQLLRFKLAPRGYTLVHGCCISKEGTSVLLPGLSHVGKTSTALGMVCRGWQYLADDYTFVGADGQTHSYLSRLNISNHVPDRYPETLTVKPRHRLSLACKHAMYTLSFRYVDFPEPLSIHDLAPTAVIAESARLGRVILLSSSDGLQLEGPFPVSRDKAVDRMLAINQWEGRHFHELLSTHAAGTTRRSLDTWLVRERQVLQAALRGVACYELFVPRQTTDFQALLDQTCHVVEQVSDDRPAQPESSGLAETGG